MDETRDHGFELIAPVVAPGETGEVAPGVIGAELAIGPGDRALDVAERRVHPFERRHAGRLSARSGADCLMAAGDLVECAPAAQAVRHNRRAGGQPVLGATRDLALAEALDRRQLQLAWAPLGTGRDRRHEGRLARRAAAPLAAGAHPAEIGVVHLDPPRKRRLPLAPRHHRHDLVLHGPGRRLLDPETAAEFHRRDAVLRRHDQVDGCKPECQRQLGRVEDRARRGRCLLLAPVALIETPTRQHAMPAMAAAGAEEAVRPAQPEQRRAALLLGAEGLAKRLVAQTTHARCNLEPHNRDPLIRNILRTYSLTCGVSRISRYDNALAETVNGLYKAEVIHRRGPWRSFEAVELATLEWVDWFNNRRLLEPIGNIPPAEAEERHYAMLEQSDIAA